MPREVKFQVWDKEAQQMYDVECYYCSGDVDILRNGKYRSLIAGYIELREYTGIKDKNGKEIYEGDILRVDNDSYGVVEYGVGCFCFHDQIDGKIALEDIYAERIAVVLGNIYENPDLLPEVIHA